MSGKKSAEALLEKAAEVGVTEEQLGQLAAELMKQPMGAGEGLIWHPARHFSSKGFWHFAEGIFSALGRVALLGAIGYGGYRGYNRWVK